MKDKRKWRVTVVADLGERLLWALCSTRRLARMEAKQARMNDYPTRITRVQRRKTD